MNDPSSDIILRCSATNRKEEWIWADIVPENWLMTLERYRKEVGVFEQPNTKGGSFLYGGVLLTYHVNTGNSTSTRWEFSDNNLEKPINKIDRPENFTVSP